MDFHDLHAFFHVASEGGFSKASTRLHVAQSALSRRVARLERILGVTLLERHGRGVRLTDEGSILFDRARRLMDELDQIERDILVLSDEPVGRVRVAMPPMISQLLGPLLVTECRDRFPRIELELSEGFSDTVQEWITEEKVDLGLAYTAGLESNLLLAPLLDEPLVLLLSPEAPASLASEPIDIRLLGRLPLVLPRRPNSLRLVLDRVAAQHEVELNVVFEVNGVHALKGFVEADLGYSIFSANGLDEPVRGRMLRRVGFAPKLSWQLALAQRPQVRAPRAFREVQQIIHALIHRLLESGEWQGERLAGLQRLPPRTLKPRRSPAPPSPRDIPPGRKPPIRGHCPTS